MTNHTMMSVIKLIAPLQVPYNKLAKSRFNVVVRIQLNNKEVFQAYKRKYKAKKADLSCGSRNSPKI